MRKIVHLAAMLFIVLPVSSQPVSKLFKAAPFRLTDNLLVKTSPKAAGNRIQPKSSTRINHLENQPSPYLVTYDVFGHETSIVSPSGLTNEIWEYDPTGQILLNKYASYRSNPESPWQKPEHYNIRTTTDASGIRTAIEHEDYDKIILNDKGLVTAFSMKAEEESEYLQGTQTWNGAKLTGLTYKDTIENNSITIELKNLELAYTPVTRFNPYQIDYGSYIMGSMDDYFGINADGNMKLQFEGEPTYSIDFHINSFTEKINPDDYDVSYVTKAESTSDDETEVVFKYMFTYTDANGSFILTNGEYPDVSTITAEYDKYGNLNRQSIKQIENKQTIQDEEYRYIWTYDNDGKPLKVETYHAPVKGEDELYLFTEEFTAWYDLSEGINDVQTDLSGEIISATLYTLSGAPVKTFTAGELNSKIELPAKGIYILNIKTDKGSVVKKIIN